MAGSATLRIELSRTMTRRLKHSTPRMSQRRCSASACTRSESRMLARVGPKLDACKLCPRPYVTCRTALLRRIEVESPEGFWREIDSGGETIPHQKPGGCGQADAVEATVAFPAAAAMCFAVSV